MKTEYLIALAAIASIATVWAVSIAFQRRRVQAPELPPDFSQVRIFAGLSSFAVLVLMGMGV